MVDQTTSMIQTRPGPVPRPGAAPPPANWEQGLINRRNSSEFQLQSMCGLLWVPVLVVYPLLLPITYLLTYWANGDWLLDLGRHNRVVYRHASLVAVCDCLAANDSSRYLQGWRMSVRG